MSVGSPEDRLAALEAKAHVCVQGQRLIRLESEAASAEADRRKLREDILCTMSQIQQELVGMNTSTSEHIDEIREELNGIRSSLDRSTRAAFARIDELAQMLGGNGHA